MTNNPIREWMKDLNRYFSKEDTCIWPVSTSKHIKNVQHH